MGEIIGIPKSDFNYEFMVCRKMEDGNFKWISNHENYPYDICEEDLVVIHDVRISHKERKKVL